MKKIIGCGMMAVLMVIMVGCGKGKTTTVCTFSQEANGIKTEEVLTIEGDGDTLVKQTSELNDTFDDPSQYQEELDKLLEEYKTYETCPGGTAGVNCSKNIKFSWSYENNILKSKEVIDVKKAVDSGDNLSTFGEVLGDREYYSVKVTVDGAKEEGYTCKEK